MDGGENWFVGGSARGMVIRVSLKSGFPPCKSVTNGKRSRLAARHVSGAWVLAETWSSSVSRKRSRPVHGMCLLLRERAGAMSRPPGGMV